MKEVDIIDSEENALVKSLQAPALDPIVLAVANEHLAGKEISQIAEEFDVSPDVITQIISQDEVKEYITSVYLNQGYMQRRKRMEIIAQVIDSKIQDAIETGVWSKKDLFDWVKLLHQMESDLQPKKVQPAVAVQINNYERLMQDLIESDK